MRLSEPGRGEICSQRYRGTSLLQSTRHTSVLLNHTQLFIGLQTNQTEKEIETDRQTERKSQTERKKRTERNREWDRDREGERQLQKKGTETDTKTDRFIPITERFVLY